MMDRRHAYRVLVGKPDGKRPLDLLSSSLLSKNLKNKIYRIIILPVVLYECETWSLILREECRLKVFENRVLRRLRRDEVSGELRRVHNEELYAVYSTPNIVRVIKSTEMGRACGTYGGEVRAGFSWGNLRGRDHFGRPRRKVGG
jgi:hypothetical protein